MRSIISVTLLFAACLGLVWLVSTSEQRQQYLVWLRLVEPQKVPTTQEDELVISMKPEYRPQAQHGSVGHYQCAPKTRATTDIENKAKVYKWTDDKGRIHYSDRTPLPQQQSQIEDLSAKYQNKAQYFRVNVEVLGKKVPAWTQDRLASSTRQIFTILSEQLNITDLRQVELNVKVFDSRWAYQNFATQAVGGVGKWSGGFYNASINTAAVLHQGRDEFTHQVARHESTHVIMAGLFGHMPTWFAEGMAEYFEHLKISGQAKSIEPDHQQMVRLQQAALPHLQSWFSQNEHWYGDQNRDMNYAVAWSVIHFLMQEEWRRHLLGSYMKALGQDQCRSVSAAKHFSMHYPGGINRMTRDWQHWVKAGKASTHYF